MSVVVSSLHIVITSTTTTPTSGANMKVSAYHSSNTSDPDVHHDHNDCPTGQQIPAHNKVSGTGGFPRCKQCRDKG